MFAESNIAATPKPMGRRRLLRVGLWLVAVLVLAASALAFWYYHRPLPSDLRRSLFQGVTYERQVREKPRRVILHIVTIDLNAPGVRFLVTPGDPAKPRPLRARLTSQFAKEFGVQIAINGDFFFPWHSKAPWSYYPHVGDPVELEGYAASNGTLYSSGGQRWKYPVLNISKDNRVSFDLPVSRYYNTISGDMLFLKAGQPQNSPASYHTEPQPRTAVAVDGTGRKLLLFVVDGRQPNYSEGLTTAELAEVVREFGGDTALNLDGGGSTTLVVQNGRGGYDVLNCPIDNHIPGRERPVANHLGVFARPLPR
jgi:hypothetical protein